MKKNKGITLIALVVTIIVMLILAGISIQMLTGENGILKRAREAKDKTESASEKEAIGMSVANYQLGKNTENGEGSKLGDALLNKGIEHQNDWHEVQTTEDSKWHGTGWNFLEKGKDFGFGDLKNSWLVNYDTGEIKKLEEGKYHSVTIHDTIAVEDSIILNLDSAMTDEGVANTKEGIEGRLGKDAVKLNNFDYETDGLIDNEFVFDGENDYITIDLKKLKENGKIEQWFENGFTFEFYGQMKEGFHKSYGKDTFGNKCDPDVNGVNGDAVRSFGIFQITEKDDSHTSDESRAIAFGGNFYNNNNYFCLMFPWIANEGRSDAFDYSESIHHWKKYNIKQTNGNDNYYSLSIEKKGETFTQTFYENGSTENSLTGSLNKTLMEDFYGTQAKLLTIGAMEHGGDGNTGDLASLGKLKAKCFRLYNRGLTDTEVKANYDKTTYYHNEVMGKDLK